MSQEEKVKSVCEHAFKIWRMKDLRFQPMKRRKALNTKKSFAIGRTNLKTKLVSIDIYTPKKRQSRKMSSILRILAHEVAHHQKKPFKELYNGRVINRQHYPAFYKQVKKNINKLKKDSKLKQYFM